MAAAGLAGGGSGLGYESDEVIDVPNAEGVAAGYTYDDEEEDVGAVVVEDTPLLPANGDAARSRPGSSAEELECAELPGAVYSASKTGATAAMVSAAVVATAAELEAAAPTDPAAVEVAPARGDAPQPAEPIEAVAEEVFEIPNRTGTPIKMSRAGTRRAAALTAPVARGGDAAAEEDGTRGPGWVVYDHDDDDTDDEWADTKVPGVVSVEDVMTASTKAAGPGDDWEEIAARVCAQFRADLLYAFLTE